MIIRRKSPFRLATRLFVTAATGATFAWSQYIEEASEVLPLPPNIVFISVDDLNQFVSVLSDRPENFLRKIFPDDTRRSEITKKLTPNLDRLGEMGVVLSKAYCPSPLCGPSRAALLSGIPTHVSGYYNHHVPFRQLETLHDVVTLPQYLQSNGYQTIGIGKIFHSSVQRKTKGTIEDWPDIEHSWSTYIQRPTASRSSNQAKITASPYSPGSGYSIPWDSGVAISPATKKDDKIMSFGTIDLEPSDTFDFENATFASQLILNGGASISDIEGETQNVILNQKQPYFIACGLYMPHLPWIVPQRFYDLVPVDEMHIDSDLVRWVEEDTNDIPTYALKEFMGDGWSSLEEVAQSVGCEFEIVWRASVQAYLASIAFADYCLGPIVKAIEENPEKDRTIVVIWSDHGWNLGDKHRFKKQALWEAANHAVLIIVAPESTIPGSVIDQNVSLQDLYPTLVDLAGLNRPEHVYGNSIVPLLRHPQMDWDQPVLMTFQPDNHVLRTNRFSYFRYADGSREYYNTDTDPYERNNLASRPGNEEFLTDADTMLEVALSSKPE